MNRAENYSGKARHRLPADLMEPVKEQHCASPHDCILWQAVALTHRYTFVSGPAELQLGYPLAAWTGEPVFWREHLYPDDRDRAIRDFAEAVCGHHTRALEYRMLHADGRVVWCRDVILANGNSAAMPQAVSGVLLDITSEKATADELQKSRERFELAALATLGVIWDWEIKAARVACYGAVQQLLGCAGGTIPPEQPWMFERIHPDDRERVKAGFQRSAKAGFRFWSDEYRYGRFDGTYAHILNRAHLLYAENGELERAVGVLADIAERNRASEALRHSEARFRALFDEAPVAYHEIDSSGIIRRVNQTECRMLAYSAAEIVGRHAWRFVRDARRDEVRARVLRTLSGELTPRAAELDLVRSDGGRVTVEVHDSAIRDPDGKIVGLRTSMIDISQRKQAEAESARCAVQLSGTNEELVTALKLAQHASELKGQFLANMSHEIRTPMNGVMGMTDLLLKSNLTREQRDYAETIKLSANSLLTIINEILDYSQIEAGKLEIEMANFDLRTLVEDLLSLFRVQAENKGLSLAATVSEDMPCFIYGDPGRIRQVLVNLLGNALKFTSAGGISLSVRACERGIFFEVRDTGIGITAEARKHLFEPFRQADGSIRRRFGGTGLGLAISKNLVELMGGVIGVESASGSGSRFWFRLPRRSRER